MFLNIFTTVMYWRRCCISTLQQTLHKPNPHRDQEPRAAPRGRSAGRPSESCDASCNLGAPDPAAGKHEPCVRGERPARVHEAQLADGDRARLRDVDEPQLHRVRLQAVPAVAGLHRADVRHQTEAEAQAVQETCTLDDRQEHGEVLAEDVDRGAGCNDHNTKVRFHGKFSLYFQFVSRNVK